MNTELLDPANMIEKICGKQEPLHPVLAAYLEVLEDSKALKGMTVLRHPLVYAVPFFPQMNAMYNQQFDQKVKAIQRAEQEGNWSLYIWMHERPHRLPTLLEKQDRMSDEQFAELLGSVWTDTENVWQNFEEWQDAWQQVSHMQMLSHTMDEDERELLTQLPDEVAVYRGHQKCNADGISWTLNPWRANWFSTRFASPNKKVGDVSRGIVRKQDILALFLGRSESEIVVMPESVQNPQPLLKSRRSRIAVQAFGKALTRFELGPKSLHGSWHWENVERNALAIAAKTPGADALVCQLFALLHDCCRRDEHEDPDHGKRAATFVESPTNSHWLTLKPSQRAKLAEACRHHNDGLTSDDPTIGACWDADRLDLPRVGITPNPELLSTQAGKELMWKI